MVTQFAAPDSLHGENLDNYLFHGWFRSGQYIYTTKILNFEGLLYSPVRIRLPLEGYNFRKSLRKVWKKNQRFQTVYRKASITSEKEILYQKYKSRLDGFVSPTIKNALLDNQETSIYDTHEVAIYDDGKLIGFSFFDLGKKGMASIMGIFDPDYERYSLGFYTMLAEIDYGKKNGFSYYYPGYIIPYYPKFDYKLRIGNVEFYRAKKEKWLPFDEMKDSDLPTQTIENQLITISNLLKTYNITHEIYFYPAFDSAGMNLYSELSGLETPLFIQLIPDIRGYVFVIEFDFKKEAYRFAAFRAFIDKSHAPLSTPIPPPTHKKYSIFPNMLIRQLVFKENKNGNTIVEEILKMAR